MSSRAVGTLTPPRRISAGTPRMYPNGRASEIVCNGPGRSSSVEGERDEHEDDPERDDRGELPHDVLDDRVVDRMQRPQQLRRQPAHPHLELEVVRVPAHRQIAHERETDVVGGEVADVVWAD